MTVYKCDRCGKIIMEKGILYTLNISKYELGSSFSKKHVDLCQDCMERIEEILCQNSTDIRFMKDD